MRGHAQASMGGTLLVLLMGLGSITAVPAMRGDSATYIATANPSASSLVQCIDNRKVATWDKSVVQVCDSTICKGAEAIPALPRPKPGAKPGLFQARLPRGKLAKFVTAVSGVDGWLFLEHVWIVKALTKLQHKYGLVGAVGEIGVHHGKFWLPITGFAYASEPAVAVDLFDDQDKNFDGSGLGNKDTFLRNANTHLGLAESEISIFAGDSARLTGASFAERGLPKFRLLSVDGGHSLETTLRDMTLAACLIADGGVMIVDDVVNPVEGNRALPWTGVPTAVFNWLLAQKRFAPFLWAHNKVYLTTVSHAAKYLEMLAEWDGVECAESFLDMHPSRYAIGPHVVCFNIKAALPLEKLIDSMATDV